MRHAAPVPVSSTPNRPDLGRHFQVGGLFGPTMNATEPTHLIQKPTTNNAIRPIRKQFQHRFEIVTASIEAFEVHYPRTRIMQAKIA